MKTNIPKLFALSKLGLVLGASAAPYLIPNGNFSIAGGENWTQFSEGDLATITYPASGGNTGGYGQIDNTGNPAAGFAILIQEGGTGPNPATGPGIPLGDLGLVAGQTYMFSLDMIDLDAGATRAGLKIESWNSEGIGSSGDNLMDLTSSWATYTIQYTINPAATHLKFVPVMSEGETGIVGFDNVGGDNSPVIEQIENGDFEIPNGAGWGTTQGTPQFPTTGGNPGGHVVLDASSEFTVLYAFENTEKNFALLGLSPGDTYTIQFDMKLVSGSGSGGIRLEGPEGYVAEIFPDWINGGANWETYTVEFVVPDEPAQTKIGLRPQGSIVAFDNVSIGGAGVAPQERICAEISPGDIVTWNPTNPASSYQLQESSNGTDWVNLGPLYEGDTVSSFFDEDGSDFYRVEESVVTLVNDAVNGDFEIEGSVDPFCPEHWECLTNDEQLPTRVTLSGDGIEPFEGDASVQLLVENADGVAEANSAEIQQNIVNQGGFIEPGATYDFSFQAKQMSFGVSYVQQYKLTWLTDEGNVLGEVGFFDFVGGDGTWNKISSTGLVVPAGATSALIQIFGTTGAVPSVDARGEVLIDDVQLVRSEAGEPTIIPAMASEGVTVTWDSEDGVNYQVKAGTDLQNLTNFGAEVTGDGTPLSVADTLSDPAKFYQVEEVAAP